MTKEKTEREHIYLAALLHDIGKFYQRADTGSIIKNTLLNLAASHHLPKEQLSKLGKLIKEADCLSSGMDRESEIALQDEQSETGWDAFKKIRMTSVLEAINLSKEELESKKDWLHLPVNEISLTKDYFPKRTFSEMPEYGKLWTKFENEFKFIQSSDYRSFSETLLNLLYKYTTCIPASTINFPDVSLYDHAKTTAALAVCLYDYQSEKRLPKETEQPFLLVGADFSGIQGYIYQIVSKYAGKNLKGRSFFLRILSDAVVRYLLQKLNLFQANVIYNSGGGFYILVPNTEFVKTQLEEATKMIEEKFFTSFGISLFVAIESVPLSKDDLMHKDKEHNLDTVWKQLFEKRDLKKNSKFATLIENGYENFFEPLMKGGDALRDEITGEEFTKNELSDNRELTIKKNTDLQIDLGKKLRDTDIMIISENVLTYMKDIFYIQPVELGYYYYFLNEKNDAKSLISVDNCVVIRFNNPNFNQPIKGNNNSYELQFYGGNEWKGQSFEEMVNPPDKNDDSFKRLGVLRMDVDNLGSIFQSGILPEQATLSRFAALSRSFDYFFSGYLNTIWKETSPDRSFIIYSGGDDVFIVGSWDVTVELAKKIRGDFREFTCLNPAFSISGGIAIVPQKFPVMKAADESDKEELAAKGHHADEKSKNAISFMDFPLNWDVEFPVVEKLKKKLVDLIDIGKEPSSLLSKIMTHAANADIKEHKIRNIKTYWMLTYDLSRMKDRTKDEDAKGLIDNCIIEVCGHKSRLNGETITTNYHPLELWAFAVRWAELELRVKNDDK
jgi:CRISPR-associated protein Csm1